MLFRPPIFNILWLPLNHMLMAPSAALLPQALSLQEKNIFEGQERKRDPRKEKVRFSVNIRTKAGSSCQTTSAFRKRNAFFLLLFCTPGKLFNFAWISPRQVSILVDDQISYDLQEEIYLISSCLFLVSRCLLKKSSHMGKRELLLENDCAIYLIFFSICKELSLVYKHERVGIKEHMETSHYLIQLMWKFNLIKRKRRIFFRPLTNHKEVDFILHLSCENHRTKHPNLISFSLINCTSP